MKSIKQKDEEEGFFFYKAIVDNLPANIQVNMVNNTNDERSFVNIWMNSKGLDFIGYTQEEISKIGNEFFVSVVHPDDFQVILNTIPRIQHDPKKSFGGLIRVKPKEGEYQWMMWCVSVMEFKNENPWKMLVISLNVSEMIDTDNQISILLKENMRLKNQLSIHSLTIREIEVLKLLSEGYINKEIAEHLHISTETAKRHRKNILHKLHLHNSASLIHFASQTGLD